MISLKELIKITDGKLISGRKDIKFQKISIDTRTLKKGEIFLAIKGQNFDGHSFLKEAIEKGAKGLIVSKVPAFISNASFEIPILRVKNTIEALNKITCFLRNSFKGSVIAVTGSNGKTTTKELIAKVLAEKYKILKSKKSHNNNIGLFLTFSKLKKYHQIVVLELGANHFGEIKNLAKIAKPNIGVITNIGKAHIGYFSSRNKVFQAKTELIRYSKLRFLITNGDDDYLRKVRFKNKILFAIKNKKSDIKAKIIEEKFNSTLISISGKKIKIPLPGTFNVYNVLAAISVGKIFKVPFSKMKKAIENYKTISLRSEIIKMKKAFLFQDCYNSNPSSAIQSLNFFFDKFPYQKVVIFGDMLELGRFSKEEHRKIGKFLDKKNPDIVICIGKYSKEVFKEIKNNKTKKFHFLKPEKAVNILKPLLNKKYSIFIKGSRKLELEKIVQALKI